MSLVAAAVVTVAASTGPADLVIENARIWSDGLVGFAPFAAVDDGRFVHVGATDANLIGPDTVRIDADGAVVIPGLVDSHVHMLGGGQQLYRLSLRDATDKIDFITRVAEWTQQLEAGEWILGGRYSVESWASPEQPRKDWLDDVTGDHPLFLVRMDGHSALANSEALRRAGITADGPENPVGGVIDRDPRTGEPTGILRESAMALVSRLVPDQTEDDQLRALRRAMDAATRHGITAVSDIPAINDLALYERLARQELTVRFYAYPTAADWVRAAPHASRFVGRPHWVQVNGLKAYLDGSLGSRTAMMRAPFLNNDPGRETWRGIWREGVLDGQFSRNLGAANAASLQAIVHAIGDEANHYLLDELAKHYDDLPAARCRSEHTQHLLPEDIERFGTLGVIASMQPYHKADDGRYAEDYIGEERCRSSYAFRSLLNRGAVLAFGSDWPVVTLNPYLGMEAAVTGRTLDGRTWQTQEALTVAEALRAYTSGGAYAVFAEDEIGHIAPGYRADFVILNASPFDPDVEWTRLGPTAVFVEGREVYRAELATP